MRLRHVLALALLGAAGSVHGQGLNVVSAVAVEDAGATVVLSIRGTRPPNFTTFSMADPPRFVIDVSEARFEGVPAEIPVDDGTIRLVKNLSYGSDASSIVRIMVAFSGEVEPPEVVTQGSDLVVRIAKLDGGSSGAQERSVADAEAPAREDAVAAARAEAERERQEEAERAAEEARRQEEAIAVGQAEAERKRQEEAERAAEAARRQEETAAAAQAEAERAEEAERQREEAISAARAEAARAPAEDALVPDAPPTQLREVGFRQLPGASRVFVRTSAPPRFTIRDLGGNVVRVELENTRVMRRNDARFLDTSFFPSAVALVAPSTLGTSYVLDITLRERVPYQQRIEGDMLAIDFERPVHEPAAPAERAAPGELVLDPPPGDEAEADGAESAKRPAAHE